MEIETESHFYTTLKFQNKNSLVFIQSYPRERPLLSNVLYHHIYLRYKHCQIV